VLTVAGFEVMDRCLECRRLCLGQIRVRCRSNVGYSSVDVLSHRFRAIYPCGVQFARLYSIQRQLRFQRNLCGCQRSREEYIFRAHCAIF